MRIWGYILVVLNIGAAGAFVYFGVQLWKARTEWQYALLKQELVIHGLPVEGPEHPPEDLDEGQSPFDFKYGNYSIGQISDSQLTKVIPAGGDALGFKGGKPVANQTDEVKRVQKIIFPDIDSAKSPNKRAKLLILLLNLAKERGREGIYALLRDFPNDKRRAKARRELAYLGQTDPEVSALQALSAIGEVLPGLAQNILPADRARLSLAGRKALMVWAKGEIANVTPDPFPSAEIPTGTDAEKPPVNEDRDKLTKELLTIQSEMESAMPAAANLDAGRQRLLALLEGDQGLQSAPAKVLLPYVAALATNPLDSEAAIADAKDKFMQLLILRAFTDAEKKSLEATANLLVPILSTTQQKEQQKEPEDKRKEFEQHLLDINTNIDVAAIELLRSYFEEALAKPSVDLPEDVSQARDKLDSLKPIRNNETWRRTLASLNSERNLEGLPPIRDPGEQRLRIAHLLYHLDAYIGAAKDPPAPFDAVFKLRLADQANRDPVVRWHQRVVAVVGLEGYVPIVEAQATQLNKMYKELLKRIPEEQSYFAAEYQDELIIIKVIAEEYDKRLDEIKALTINREAREKQLAIRVAEQKKLEAELAVATDKAKTALQNLEVKVDELFQLTKQLGEAQDALVSLEINLRELELKPLEKKK